MEDNKTLEERLDKSVIGTMMRYIGGLVGDTRNREDALLFMQQEIKDFAEEIELQQDHKDCSEPLVCVGYHNADIDLQENIKVALTKRGIE